MQYPAVRQRSFHHRVRHCIRPEFLHGRLLPTGRIRYLHACLNPAGRKDDRRRLHVDFAFVHDIDGGPGTRSFDEQIKSSHSEAFDDVGLDAGTPVIRIRDQAVFGPVITPAPRGEAAGRLWDGLALVTEADGFFELRRSRDRKPSFE
jgi:hypothetical protein